MRRGSHVRERELPHLLEDLNPLRDISEVERVVERGHDVLAHLTDLEHLSQLRGVARDEVEEREPLKVLRFLVRHLNHLVNPLPQRFATKDLPALVITELHCCFHRTFEVTALDRKVEAHLVVLDEVKRDLREKWERERERERDGG